MSSAVVAFQLRPGEPASTYGGLVRLQALEDLQHLAESVFSGKSSLTQHVLGPLVEAHSMRGSGNGSGLVNRWVNSQ